MHKKVVQFCSALFPRNRYFLFALFPQYCFILFALFPQYCLILFALFPFGHRGITTIAIQLRTFLVKQMF